MPTFPDEDLVRRLQNPMPFFRRLIEEACLGAIRILQENMFGEQIKQGWRFEATITEQEGRARIFHEYLDQDRDTWEIVFWSHNSGSKRYMIYPKIAQALSWIDEDSGERVFSPGHEVGGIQARHFAERCTRFLEDFERTIPSRWNRWCETGQL